MQPQRHQHHEQGKPKIISTCSLNLFSTCSRDRLINFGFCHDLLALPLAASTLALKTMCRDGVLTRARFFSSHPATARQLCHDLRLIIAFVPNCAAQRFASKPRRAIAGAKRPHARRAFIPHKQLIPPYIRKSIRMPTITNQYINDYQRANYIP